MFLLDVKKKHGLTVDTDNLQLPDAILRRMVGNARAVKLKWTPGKKNSGATSGHDGVICSRLGSVGAFCMK